MAEQTEPVQSTRKTPLEEYSKTLLGLIALFVVGVLVAALLLVKAFTPGYREYTAQFAQAAALQPGNPVTVAGIEVGTVSGLKLAGDRVEVAMRVKNNVPLGKDSRATIKITTILGSRYLALQPGGGGDLPNNTIDLNHTEVPYDLQAALADVADTYEQVNTDQFAESLGILGKQLESLPPVVPQAMQNIQTLSNIIADRRDQLGDLLKGEGFPVERRGPRGDQRITISPIFPERMTTDQQILLDQLIATTSGPDAKPMDERLRGWNEALRTWKQGRLSRG